MIKYLTKNIKCNIIYEIIIKLLIFQRAPFIINILNYLMIFSLLNKSRKEK